MLFFSGPRLARLAFHAAAAFGCAGIASGCGADANHDSTEQPMGGAGGSAGSTAGASLKLGITDPLSGQTVELGDDAKLVRPPNSLTHFWIQTEPFQLVRTTLLPNGDQTPGSAALDWTLAETQASGRVTLILTAPSTPTSFLLQAWATGVAPRQVEITIAQLGSASLRVLPLYAGRRAIERWTASAVVDQDCAALRGSPPPDGAYANEAMDPPQLDAVTIANVPVGPPLAVLVRAAEYAWGCANLTSAIEGQTNAVQVTVTNVPMRLSTRAVALDMTLASRGDWTALFEAPIATALDATLAGAADDVEALLNAMQASLGSAARNEFSEMRTLQGWDVHLRTALGTTTAPTGVRAPLERWMRAGLADMKLERAFEARLDANASGTPELRLAKGFGFEADTVRMRTRGSTSFSADARDSVLIGTELEVDPARLLLSSARGPATQEVEGAGNVSQALAELMSCDTVADTLIDWGLDSGNANADCDDDCARELCQDAVAELVGRASNATQGDVARIEIAISGPGHVGARAELSSLDGSWLGKFSRGEVTADLGGSATIRND
jgi:hypothetical protein